MREEKVFPGIWGSSTVVEHLSSIYKDLSSVSTTRGRGAVSYLILPTELTTFPMFFTHFLKLSLDIFSLF